jgi:hypothetical protein
MPGTLKRELKVLEIVEREAFEIPICSFFLQKSQRTCEQIQLILVERVSFFSLSWVVFTGLNSWRSFCQGGVEDGTVNF